MINYKTEYIEGDGNRYYVDNDDNKYISVTTLIKKYEEAQALEAWKLRVGEEESIRIRDESAAVGKDTHAQIENYLDPNSTGLGEYCAYANLAIDFFYKAVIPHSQEEVLFYEDFIFDEIRWAGRYDQLVYIDNHIFNLCESTDYLNSGLYLVDLKTKRTNIPRVDIADFILKYCIQLGAYKEGLRTYKDIKINGAILVFTTNKKCKVYYLNNEKLDFYWNIFYSMLHDHYIYHTFTTGKWKEWLKQANLIYDLETHRFKSYLPIEIRICST